MNRLRLSIVLAFLALASVSTSITYPGIHVTVSGPDSPSGVQTADANTTGADLLVSAYANYETLPCSSLNDNKNGGGHSALTASANSGSSRALILYLQNPTVGSGHHWSSTGSGCFPTLMVAAFTGAHLTTPFDQENGSASTGTSAATGSITPSENCELVVSISSIGATSTETPNSGMTVIDTTNYGAGDHFGGTIAYKLQTTAAAINVTWSGSSVARAVRIASFKAATVNCLSTGRPSILLLGVGN